MSKNDFFKDMSINQYDNLGAKVSENVEIITNNSFKDINNNEMENIPGAKLLTFTKNILDNIDLEDRKYILREKKFGDLINDESIEGLSTSIYEVGLINPVYIQEKDNKKYRIISGYRRTVAIKIGYLNYGNEYSFDGKVVIIPKNYSQDDLEVFQINENTHRENLSILELAYRFHLASKKRNLTIEDLGEEYNMSSRQIKRIKGSLNYPKSIKKYLDVLKLSKAEEINKIVKILNLAEEEIEGYILQVKDLSRDELRDELKRIKSNKNKELIEFNHKKNYSTIKINKKLKDVELKIIIKMIENKLLELKE